MLLICQDTLWLDDRGFCVPYGPVSQLSRRSCQSKCHLTYLNISFDYFACLCVHRDGSGAVNGAICDDGLRIDTGQRLWCLRGQYWSLGHGLVRVSFVSVMVLQEATVFFFYRRTKDCSVLLVCKLKMGCYPGRNRPVRLSLIRTSISIGREGRRPEHPQASRMTLKPDFGFF